MENLNCFDIVAFIVLIVLTSMLSFETIIQPAAAQQFSMSHRILLDNSEGNTVGWNTNGNRISFTIFDNQFNLESSTVIVNTFQSNFVACNVDYKFDGAFQGNCNKPPAIFWSASLHNNKPASLR